MKTQWEKASEEVKDLFYKLAPTDSQAEHRKMFGYPCCFYNGNMFMGVHGNNIVLRLREEDRNDFINTYDAKIFEPMPGRKMKEYCVIPKSVLEEHEHAKEWTNKSISYVKTLPPKKKKVH